MNSQKLTKEYIFLEARQNSDNVTMDILSNRNQINNSRNCFVIWRRTYYHSTVPACLVFTITTTQSNYYSNHDSKQTTSSLENNIEDTDVRTNLFIAYATTGVVQQPHYLLTLITLYWNLRKRYQQVKFLYVISILFFLMYPYLTTNIQFKRKCVCELHSQ